MKHARTQNMQSCQYSEHLSLTLQWRKHDTALSTEYWLNRGERSDAGLQTAAKHREC